jgi:hypothetical protein
MKFRYLLIGAAALAAGVALGQVDVVEVVEVVEPSVAENLVKMWLPWAVVAASALTAIFPSTNKVMLFIDFFAMTWGKARNDPNAQKWGK